MTVGGVVGKPAPFEQGDDLVAGGVRRLRLPWTTSGSATSCEHGHPRVQRGVRVLEHELHPPAQAAQLLARRAW